ARESLLRAWRPYRSIKGWPSRQQEFNHAGISGGASTGNCDHFVRGRQSLWAPQPGIAGTARSERGAGVENGPGWRGAYCDGWRATGDFLLPGMPRITDGDYFKTCGSAKSGPEQSAITGS